MITSQEPSSEENPGEEAKSGPPRLAVPWHTLRTSYQQQGDYWFGRQHYYSLEGKFGYLDEYIDISISRLYICKKI
jgi:hypothetical protein